MIISRGDNPSVVAIIPTLGRNLGRLTSCIESIDSATGNRGIGIIIVWNSSKRPDLEIENVHILQPGMNLGFPGALAYARQFINAPFLWLIQDDVRVLDGCIEHLIDTFERNDDVGIASPVSLNERGNIPAGGRAGLFDSQGRISASFPPTEVSPAEYEFPADLGYVASSGSLISTRIWDLVGGFDPDFFPLLWSDADFCHRVGLLGFQSVVTSTAHVTHEVNGSTPGLLHEYMMIRNGEKFRKKHFASDEPEDTRLSIDVDAAILHDIARTASELIIDFASFASQRANENEIRIALLSQSNSELNEQNESMSQELSLVTMSKVWRYSRPFRMLRRMFASR